MAEEADDLVGESSEHTNGSESEYDLVLQSMLSDRKIGADVYNRAGAGDQSSQISNLDDPGMTLWACFRGVHEYGVYRTFVLLVWGFSLAV